MTSSNNPLYNKTTTTQYKTNISGAILEVYILLTAVWNIHETFNKTYKCIFKRAGIYEQVARYTVCSI